MKRILKNKYFNTFIVSSLFLHFFVWISLNFAPNDKPHKKEVVEIDFIKPSESTANKAKQIVQQDKTINDEVDENAKHLSRFNQKVAKETRAARTGKFTNKVQNGQNGKSQKQDSQKTKKTSHKALGEIPRLSDLKPSYSFAPKPNEATFEASKGQASQTDDHLKDLEIGLQTMLGTREFVYYSYYQRIRSKIRQFWEPSIREKVRKIFASGRTLASTRDRITRVIIVLNKEGSLIKVQIVGQSGIHDLDDAAVEAFRAAEPFPNPPKGIIEKDGTIKIRWDFILEARHNKQNPQENYSFGRLGDIFPYIS